MSALLLICIYCVFVILASLLGGWIPSFMRMTHTRIQLLMSMVGGLMLGIGLFHLLPHAVASGISLDRAIAWLMGGLLTTFFLIRMFHSHQHGPMEDDVECEHEHHKECPSDHDHGPSSGSPFRWIGIAAGLSLHTFLDGAALGASVLYDKNHAPEMMLAGFAVFIGVLLHKPLDSLSITSLMAAAGWPARSQHMVNIGYALMCPIGALIFYLGAQHSTHQTAIIGCALAFSAGIFICISLSDLLPELQFHTHDRIKLSAALLFGVALAYGIGYLEPEHAHSHGARHEAHGDHAGHGHREPH